MPPAFTCRLCGGTVDAWLPLGDAPWRVMVDMLIDHLGSLPHREDPFPPIPDTQTLLEGLLARVYDPPAGFDVTRGIAAN